jgi:hypothetical protein
MKFGAIDGYSKTNFSTASQPIFQQLPNLSVLLSFPKTCDTHFICQLRVVNPSTWICPFYCHKAAFFGHTI